MLAERARQRRLVNPDKYLDKNNKTIPSCYSIDKQTGLVKINNNKKWNERLSLLKENIDYWLKNETKKTIEFVQLYYDSKEINNQLERTDNTVIQIPVSLS
jgi:hypothetical protein